MIIVSQNKKTIINFDQITRINIINNDGQTRFIEESGLNMFADVIKETTGTNYKELKDFGIYAWFDDSNIIIGQYKTEERAKEVLNQLSDEIENWENLIAGQPTGTPKFKYYMPED